MTNQMSAINPVSQLQRNIPEDNANDIKKLAKGASTFFIGSMTGRGLWIVSQIIVARTLGPEIFGLYIIGLVVAKISGELARLGLQSGAMRFISIYRKNEPGKVKGTIIVATLITFVVGILIGGLVYVLSGFISENIFHNAALIDVIKGFVPCIPFISTILVASAVTRGFHTTKYSVAIVHVIQPSTNILCVMIFVLLDFGVIGVIYSYFISHTIATFAGYYFISIQFPGIKNRKLKPVYEVSTLLKYSTPLLVSGLLFFIISWVDIFMLGFIKSSLEVGIYRAASQIPLLLLMIMRAFSSIYAPAIAELNHNNQAKRLERLLKISTRWIFLLALPATLILIFSARDIMAVFGSEYIETGAQVLAVLAVAHFFNCITGSIGSTLAMTGKQKIEMVNNIAVVIINIVLNYFLIMAYGTVGAAIATGVSIGLINLLRLLEVYIIYKIQPYSWCFLPWIVCGAVSVIAIYFIGILLPDRSCIISLISNVVVVVSVFIIMFVIMKPSDDDKLLFDTISKKFKFKKICPEV